MTIQEIKQAIAEARKANEALAATVKAENRGYSAEELGTINANLATIADLRMQLDSQEAEQADKAKQPAPVAQATDLRSVILDAVDGKRDQNLKVSFEERALTSTTGAAAIDTVIGDILEPLRNRMVLGRAGATYMTGLTGNVKLPVVSGSSATWEDENAAVSDSSVTISAKELKPKRLSVSVPVSLTFLRQDAHNVSEIIKRDMIERIAEKLEATILGEGAGDAKTPKGIFNGAEAAGTMGFDALVDLETAADGNNTTLDSAKYVLNTKLYGAGKKTLKSAGVAGYVIENGEANGYGVERSNSVAENCVAFGDFKELFIGLWGDAEIVVDPYTQIKKGIVDMVLNVNVDAVVRNDKAIVVKKFA